MRTLYISHQGMLEPLGHSQVLAYLRGLSRRGVEIDLISYELPDADEDAIADLQATLRGSGLRWTPLRRARDTRLRVKLSESSRGVFKALSSAVARRPDVVHGRSYLPTAVSDVVASLVPGARLVFDCRGLLADEFVDAGHWTPERLEYHLVKRYEARAFRRAEGVVVLTEALKRWIEERGWLGAGTHVEAIPCCVDLAAFRVDDEQRTLLRRELGLEGTTTVVYSGSLSSWYRDEDLARFAGITKRLSPDPVRFLVLTTTPSNALVEKARACGLTDDEIIVRRVCPRDMPRYLSVGDIGLSFIKSCFSKIGSSPTKVAEYFACGLVPVLNGDIGDQAELAAERDACVVLRSFSEDELIAAAREALALSRAPFSKRLEVGRRVANERFGLERVGVARYQRLYESIVARRGRPRVSTVVRDDDGTEGRGGTRCSSESPAEQGSSVRDS